MSDLFKPCNFLWHSGTYVRKPKGAAWEGQVVGFYSTDLTPEGYAVESAFHPGSVQFYPVGALEEVK